jgi:AcrR family transcriptional regulator
MNIKSNIKETKMSDKNDLQEFKADHSGGDVVKGAEVPDPVTPAGGEIKKKLADVKKAVDPAPKKLGTKTPGQTMGEETDEEADIVVEEVDITEAFASIFEGTDISEEVIGKFGTIFEAAVNEAASVKAAEIAEALEEQFQEELEESLNQAMEEIVENLDNYLDYVVSEWMEENAVAIESGIKVEMAESFMEGLKELFYEHNVEIDEETVDVVGALEEELEEAVSEANRAINANIELSEEIGSLRAEIAFREISEGLTTSQVERLRVLSEKLDVSDIDAYYEDLGTLKESFFKAKPVITESVTDEEEELLVEETKPARVSQFDSVNAIASFLDKHKK